MLLIFVTVNHKLYDKPYNIFIINRDDIDITAYMIGKIINNYVIERKLGGGGMGDVYYAKHNKVEREVAIKVLHSHLFSNESIHNRFKNEANALIKLNHPNIVKIFDYVEQDNFACLVMEYIDGYTLDDYISKITGPLPSPKASMLICSIIDAVQYAHDNNVYHRDIKPANIMINNEGNRVRIMDFGIAKLTDSKNFKTTHANTQLGTPFYMSPEQIKGLPYTRMSDIYSLGVTLFEMVTGKCPYHHITSLFELQSKIVNEPLPQTTDYYPEVSIRIQNAITKATQKTPELRFQSCAEFKDYLQDQDVIDVQAPAFVPEVVTEPKSKRKVSWLAYAFVAVALIAAGGIIYFYLSQNTVTPTETQTPLDPAPSDTVVSEKTTTTSVDTLSIQDQNKAILEIYLDRKQKESGTKLSARQLSIFNKETQAIKHVTSDNELRKIFDSYFVVKTVAAPIILDPGQVKNDLCSVLGKFPKGIPFETRDQISEVTYATPNANSINAQGVFKVTVRYKITAKDDVTDSEYGSETLKYLKSGNSYTFVR